VTYINSIEYCPSCDENRKEDMLAELAGGEKDEQMDSIKYPRTASFLREFGVWITTLLEQFYEIENLYSSLHTETEKTLVCAEKTEFMAYRYKWYSIACGAVVAIVSPSFFSGFLMVSTIASSLVAALVFFYFFSKEELKSRKIKLKIDKINMAATALARQAKRVETTSHVAVLRNNPFRMTPTLLICDLKNYIARIFSLLQERQDYDCLRQQAQKVLPKKQLQ
jgi:hypothetical protein